MAQPWPSAGPITHAHMSGGAPGRSLPAPAAGDASFLHGLVAIAADDGVGIIHFSRRLHKLPLNSLCGLPAGATIRYLRIGIWKRYFA